jgi:hypothetical protein
MTDSTTPQDDAAMSPAATGSLSPGEAKRKLMDSLTAEQRKGIAEIIREADIEGDYNWNGEDSVWEEDTSKTLHALANYFEDYDPSSVIG